MTYPRVEVYLDKIIHNTMELVKLCSKHDIEVAGVTKVFCGIPQIAEAMIKGGVSIIADSRVENLKKLSALDIPKLLLRLPMVSQAEDVVEYCDISLNSEVKTIRALSKYAVRKGRTHKIILMVDLGDLREGVFESEKIFNTVEEILKIEGINIIGLGTNLTCYGGVIPSNENLSRLVSIRDDLENKFKISLDILSGGNSSSIFLMEKGEMPQDINQLRLGEAIVLGRETAFGNKINDTFDDCFKLAAEIIEIKDKPSIPIGNIGMNAFGKKPTFVDKGIRKKAIIALGKQDVELDDIIPEDHKITILGGSSDHIILDITDSQNPYDVGDKILFKLNYGGILKTTTSEYISKIFIKEDKSRVND